MVAGRCTNRLSKPIPLLAVAQRFCTLRSEWCQQWGQPRSAARAGGELGQRLPVGVGFTFGGPARSTEGVLWDHTGVSSGNIKKGPLGPNTAPPPALTLI